MVAYPFAALGIGAYAERRGLLVPACVVGGMWLAGIAWQLRFGASPPVALYLAMDLPAFVWFASCEDRLGRAFAATFEIQVALHLLSLAGLPSDPLAYYAVHAASAFAQLAVLWWWAHSLRPRVEFDPLAISWRDLC